MTHNTIRMRCVGRESGKTCFQDACFGAICPFTQSLLHPGFPEELFMFSQFPSTFTQSSSHTVLAFVSFIWWKTCWDHQNLLLAKSSGNFHSSLNLDHLAVMTLDHSFSPWWALFRVLWRQKIFLGLSFHSLLLLKVSSLRTQSIFFLCILIHFKCLAFNATCVNQDGLGYNPNK